MSVKVKKAKGPLQNTLRVTDDLKKQFDDLLHDTLEKDVLEPAVKKDFYQRCIHLKNLVEKNMEALQNLRKSDEPAPVGSYELLKEEGEQRLLKLSEKLQKLTLTLAQGDGELREPSIRTQSKASVGEDDIDEDSEEQEDEEDDEDEEEEEEDCDDKEEEDEDDPEFDSVIKEFITLGDFQAQQKDDLTIQKGEVLLILDKRPDGWWVAQNSKGIKGIVPKTYLEVFKKGEENQEPSEEETEEEEEEEEEKAAADDEKSASKKRPAEDTVSQTSSVKKTQEMSTTDALIETGTIPAGFCSSTLAQLLEQGEHFRTSMYLQPELSPSQLSFKDLQWDHEQDCIQVLPTRVSCILTLWSCKMIPLPAASIQILSRHVRLCLSDGAKVLSNIHTVRATWQPKNSKTWTFSPRVTGILPSLLDGGCFARTGSQSADIGILFELGITYIRNSTGERGELSCGWTFLKLFDVNGVPVPPKTYELTLNGGTPYERGIEVDPTISRRANSGVFHQMMTQRKQPRLLVKLRSSNNRRREMLKFLPETIVGSMCYIPLLVLYRQIAGDVLLKERASMQNADLICNPLLATFSRAVEHPDIMDALRSGWAERQNSMKRSEKRDKEFMKNSFIQVYHDTVYPLLQSTILQGPKRADDEIEASRWKVIADFLKQNRERDGSLHLLLSHDNINKPFDISEITYDFLDSTRKTLVSL